MMDQHTKRDFLLLISSRVCTRMGDGFLRILAVLLVAAKTKDPMIAALVLVFRYVCEILINAVSGPLIDRIRIRNSLMTSDLLRTGLSLLMVAAALLGYPYTVFLVLSFLGDFVFIFFKPAVDKVIKVSFPVREGTKVLSQVDAVNQVSNIIGFTLASFVGGWFGLKLAVCLGPIFFFLSFVLVARLKLHGEQIIDYAKVRKQSYWASQKEGLSFTWASPQLRILLIGRSIVAVGRGAFTALSVVYLADIAKGLSAYGYFESAQSMGKIVATAFIIPLFFAYRSTFALLSISLLVIGLSFFGFNLVGDVAMACVVGAMVGMGQASEAVGVDACINRFADAHIQARTKSTTSFGSRLSGLASIGVVYFLVTAMHFEARALFGWLGAFPILGAVVFFMGWMAERAEEAKKVGGPEIEAGSLSTYELVEEQGETDRIEEEAGAFFMALQQSEASGLKEIDLAYGGVDLRIGLPALGEGDRGLVHPLSATSIDLTGPACPLCIKIAKQQPICRVRLLEEGKTTSYFLSENMVVPRIHYMDPKGRFAIKEYIEGESITSLYLRFDNLTIRTQSLILDSLEDFIHRLLALFKKRPDCKVSISPNNIYIQSSAGKYSDPPQFVLIDPGTTLRKNYDGFSFDKYWNEILPDRIKKYERTGYLQWLTPREITRSERDEIKEFEIFKGLKPVEISQLMGIAKSVELEPEEVILKEGAIGSNFYLILDGEVELRKGNRSNPSSWVTRIGRGSVLGEMAFLLNVPRSMTAVAATPCKLIEMDYDRFHKLLASRRVAPYKLIYNIAGILAERVYSLDKSYQKLLESQPGIVEKAPAG
jgi:CRP-like cAMP-binding protein